MGIEKLLRKYQAGGGTGECDVHVAGLEPETGF
jgi:hypothetical protein